MSAFIKCSSGDGYPPRIVCFVCGAEGPADYPLFMAPHGTTGDNKLFPYFPFLRKLEPPLGCRPPSPDTAAAASCRSCYSSLIKQWNDNDKGGVPLENRVYWTKRQDGLAILQPDQQLAINRAEMSRCYPAGFLHGLNMSRSSCYQLASLEGTASAAGILSPSAASRLLAAPPHVVAALAGGSGVGGVNNGGLGPMPAATLGLGVPPPPAVATTTIITADPVGSWRGEMGPPPSSSASMPLLLTTLDGSTASLPPPPQDNDNDSGALDLSSGSREREGMKSRSSVLSHISAASHHSSYMSEGAGSSTDILDLTLPDKNAATEVCYVCGDDYKRGALLYINTRQVPRQAHYPSLVLHSRPPRSRPMDSAGRVQSCEECCQFLFLQWEKFEFSKVAHADRNYILRKRHSHIVDAATFVCYICALDYHSSSLRLLYCRANSESEPYYPHIEQQRPPPGVSPISSGGMVQVCSHCYKCTREKHQGLTSSSSAIEPPPKKRKSSRASVEIVMDPDQQLDDEDKASPADIECLLCRRKFTVHSFKYLHSQGPPFGGLPYFPFLRTLPRLNDDSGGFACEEDAQARVRACQTCTTSLINQWTTYQRDALPIDERTYYYQSLAGPQSSGRVTPGTLLSRATATPTSGRSVHSPTGGSGGGVAAASGNSPAALLYHHQQQQFATSVGALNNTPSKSQPLSESVRHTRPNSNSAQYGDNNALLRISVVEQQQQQQQQPYKIAKSSNLEPRPRSDSNPHSPRITTVQPPTCHSPISVHSTASAADPCSSKPSTSSFYCFLCGFHSELSFARMLYSQPQGKKAPYFPFMKDHTPKPRAETIREDGTAIVCTFCYHSVITQWTRYQECRNPIPAGVRVYNINDYVCYVCGVRTYRKRIRALRVVDFPFLRTHKAAKGTITMENGEMSAVCLDCFETLKHQFSEAAKYGIPVEKRQYNWMQIPPPPEDSGLHFTTPKERLHKHLVGQC